ncbi:MAG: DUF3375 domain-containing protein [Cyanobacteria bacterium J06627_28]
MNSTKIRAKTGAMDYEQIKYELNTSATLKLLKSRNVAFVVSFLNKQFKETHRLSIPQFELEEKLESYSDYLQDIYRDLLLQPPKAYLNDWCNQHWLRKTFDNSDEPVFSLTPATEKAIAWLEELQQREAFVGTESRFLQILALLKEIQDRSTVDVEKRIAQLEKDRDRIQQEIDQIQSSGAVEVFSQTQLQERFISADRMTRQLMADFKTVEQNFRALTRKVQAAQIEKDSRRGTVVGKVLDADDALKESPQGQSFETFYRFLNSEREREQLKATIQAVYGLDELRSLTSDYTLLRQIERNLLNAASHIVKSNHQLTEKLRQMLDERNMRENRRVAELIVDVQRLALQVADTASEEKDFWSISGAPTIQMVMERPLHPLEASEVPTFEPVDLTELDEEMLEAELDQLARQFFVDEAFLADRVDLALEARATIPLPELIALYPVTKGLPEIVAYISLATQSEKHLIDPSTIDLVEIAGLAEDTELQLELPRVVFSR